MGCARYADLGHRPIHDAMRQAFDRIDRADSTLKLDWTRYGRGLQADIERTFVDLVSTALDQIRAANSIQAAKPAIPPAPLSWGRHQPSATTDVDESVPF